MSNNVEFNLEFIQSQYFDFKKKRQVRRMLSLCAAKVPVFV